MQDCDLTRYFDEIQLQYVPYYSYGEEIAVLSERVEERLSFARSFESFTERLIDVGSPWDKHDEILKATKLERKKDEIKLGEKAPDEIERVEEAQVIVQQRTVRQWWQSKWLINFIIIFFIGFVLLFLNRMPYVPIVPESITITPTTLTPTITPTPTITLTPTITSTPTSTEQSSQIEVLQFPISCNHQYPPDQEGWVSEYKVRSFITLRDLYVLEYGDVPDNNDLYAIVYYNNRKALEGSNYHIINPIILNVEKDWYIFLPPPTWIDEYKEFPRPILEALNEDNITIRISGTSALFPLSMQMSECYKRMTNHHQFLIVTNSSTKLGLYDYCVDFVDMFAGSEVLTQEMIDTSGCNGVEFYKFEIAKYAIAIFISNTNPYASEIEKDPLNTEELRRLLFTANLWSDVRNTWGDELIRRYYPTVEGGEFEIVRNELFPKWNENSEIPNLIPTEGDGELISGVVDNAYSIGFSSYGNYEFNREYLRAISVEGVPPSLETITNDDSGYPLTRQLYLYTGVLTYDTNPALQNFISYYLTYEIDFLNDLGYFEPNNLRWLNNPYTIP